MNRNLQCSLGLSLLVSTSLLAQSQADAEAFVKNAIVFAKANGAYKLIKAVNAQDPQFHKGELYIWCADLDGVMIAHGANPKLIGKDFSERQDADAIRYVQEAVKVAQDKGSGWIEYKFMNPVTKQVQPKVCFVEKYETIVVCCGIYKK